ncbi:hypothetical protein [Planctomonas psychrotolerans]|uniref:hypothetical protein n=1 Tax=Planctomonas psychrotolerans TaxID=2528712 RepID=UPI001D0D568A|nr:hypothetical protein [Planctomonas psychrotolerans]
MTLLGAVLLGAVLLNTAEADAAVLDSAPLDAAFVPDPGVPIELSMPVLDTRPPTFRGSLVGLQQARESVSASGDVEE